MPSVSTGLSASFCSRAAPPGLLHSRPALCGASGCPRGARRWIPLAAAMGRRGRIRRTSVILNSASRSALSRFSNFVFDIWSFGVLWTVCSVHSAQRRGAPSRRLCLHLSGSAAPRHGIAAFCCLSWPRCPGARDGAAAGAAAALDHGAGRQWPVRPRGAASPPPPVMPIGMYGQPVYYAPPIAYAPMYAASAPRGGRPTGYSQQPYASGSRRRLLAALRRGGSATRSPSSRPYRRTRRRPTRSVVAPPSPPARLYAAVPPVARRATAAADQKAEPLYNNVQAGPERLPLGDDDIPATPADDVSIFRTRAGAAGAVAAVEARRRPSSRRAGARFRIKPDDSLFPSSPDAARRQRLRGESDNAVPPALLERFEAMERPRRASAGRRMLVVRRVGPRTIASPGTTPPASPPRRGPSGPACDDNGVGGDGAGGARNGASGRGYFFRQASGGTDAARRRGSSSTCRRVDGGKTLRTTQPGLTPSCFQVFVGRSRCSSRPRDDPGPE